MVKPESSPLSDRDRAILDFEELWPRPSGAKEAAIRSTFSLSNIRYYQILNTLVRKPAAVAAYPMVCKRVQESLRRSARSRAQRVVASGD
jgi:hypothetical protein